MTNVKITDLNQDTAPARTDVLPFVDVSSDETKKVTIADLFNTVSASVSVKDFGAVGDGVTDDTSAIQAAVDAAELLVLKRHYGGVSVVFPSGAYLITSTITIEESNIPSGGGRNGITLVGEGKSCSSIIAQDPNFDFVSFVGTSTRSYYGGGVKDLGFVAIGNATSGALLKMYRTIGSVVDNISHDGGFENLVLDGCADLFISNFLFNDISRTGGTCSSAIRFKATQFLCSDVHLSNVQIKPTSHAPTYSIIINGSDGIYCTNGHQFGGLRFEPQGIGQSQATASTYWSNWYFDTSSANNVLFIGNTDTASKFTNHRFVSCDMRDADRGFVVNDLTAVSNVIVSDCRIGGEDRDGLYFAGSLVDKAIVSDCIFNDNNSSDVSTSADLRINSSDVVITGCVFRAGGASGKALDIGSVSDTLVSDCNFNGSTAGTKIDDGGTGTQLSSIAGVTVTNSGTATIAAGQQNVTVTHGVDLLPSIETVSVTPITDGPGVTRWYADSRTATSFAIRTNTSPTADMSFAWQISYK